MKNVLSLKAIALLCFLLNCTQISRAHDYDNDYRSVDSCCEQVIDCGNPLYCGSVNFLVHAGVAPTIWKDRGDFFGLGCNSLAVTNFNQATISFFQLPKFREFFRLPWIVGGQIGYAITDCFEVYLEVNYRQASRRDFALNNITPVVNFGINVALVFDNHYRAIDFYAGARYYWGRCWCDRVAFFFGGKFGFVHHKRVNTATFSLIPVTCPADLALSIPPTAFFLRNTVPASGLNLGFDWCVGCGWSVVFMAEVVATCGPKGNNNFFGGQLCPTSLATIGSPTNFFIGHIGTELFFPITVGLKYSF